VRASNELRRDLLALRRHLWFLIVVFVVALAAAAASLFIAPASDEASFRASVSVFSLSPLAEPNTLAIVPTTDDFARLSTSPEALEKTSQALSQQGVNIPPDELAAQLSARARRSQNAIDFTVKTDDSDLSLQIARAWSQAFAELAPAKAPDLERQSTGGYQVQLDRAKTQLEQKRQVLTYLGVATLPGETGASPQAQFSALAATYQAKTEALAQREVERSDIQNTLDTLRAAVESGTSSLSTAQLRLLLAGVLPADTDLGPTLTTAQAITALQLRLTALDSSLTALRQEVQGLEATLNQRSGSTQLATAELQAAEQNYEAASRIVQSYELLAEQLTVTVAILKSPYAARAGVLDWTARLAAAAAFAAVVGVLGALALEQMSRRGSRAAPTPTPGLAPRPLSRNPSPPAGVSLTKLRPNTPQPGKRKAWERPTQLGATGLAILLLVGVLGTMNQRQRSRHRREGRGNL
jgi:hypothetical protein